MNNPIGTDAKMPNAGRHEKQQKKILHWLDKCRRYKMSLMVGLIGLALSLTAFFVVNQWETQLHKSGFERLAGIRCQLFEQEVRWNLVRLLALRQFFDGSQSIDRNGFVSFIEPLHQESQHPVSFHWAPRVPDSDRRSFEEAVQAEGFTDFNIHYDSPAGGIDVITQQRDCYPVLYRCHDAIWAMGFDIFSEPNIKKAIEKAIDIDQPVVTTSAIFADGQKDWPVTLFLHSIYHKDLPITTVEERRLAVEGIVVCVMGVDDIFDQVVYAFSPAGINMEIADVSSIESKQFLYQYKARLRSGDTGDDPNEESEASGLVYTTTFKVADRTWEMRATPSLGYLETHSVWVCWIVFLGGLLLTALLVMRFYSTQNRTIMIEKLVIDRTVQLQESIDRFQIAFETANIAICLVDADSRITSVNKQMCRMYGYTKEELESMTIKDITHPKDLDVTPRFIQSVLSDKINHQRFIKRYIHKEGHILWGEVSSSAIRDAQGNPSYFISYILDITEHKRAVEALQESEAHFKTLVETIPDLVWLKNPDGVYLSCNRRFESFFGAKEEEIVGKTDFDFLSKDEAESFRNKDLLAIEAGKPTINEEEITFADDGHKEFLETIKTPLFGSDGSLIGVLGVGRDITERKQAEEALRESEEKQKRLSSMFRLMCDNLPEFIWTKDLQGKFMFANKSCCEDLLNARDVYEPVGKTDIFFGKREKQSHPENPNYHTFGETCSGTDRAVLENKKVIRGDEAGNIKGKFVILDIIKSPFWDENGKLIGTVGCARDVTRERGIENERKQAEEALQESEERYRLLAKNSLDVIWKLDLNLEFIYVNPAIFDVFGFTPEEWRGTILSEHCSPEEMQKTQRMISHELENLEKHTGVIYETSFFNKNGEEIPCEVNARILSDENGRPTGLQGITRDITERKQAEKALAESENRFRNIAESMADWIWEVNSKGVYTYASSNVESILGYGVDEIIGKTPFDFIAPEEAECVSRLFQLVIENKGPIKDLENWNLTKDGRSVCLLTNGIPLFDNQGNLLGYRGVDKDITEIKRLQELESRAGRLEMAGTIAGQVAHDFNNLLGPILAYPEMIRDELPHDHEARAYLDAIEYAAGRIAEINQDLLTMGRRGHYTLNVLDLNDIVLRAVQGIESRAETVTCEKDLCEDLLRIKGGSAQLHRMLTNLLANAQDAMEDVGRITIRTENYYADDTSIVFGRVPRGEYVKLTVSDNGCGIPDDIIQKVFDPFFSTKTSNKKRGSGLGLSVVDAVMKDHNGYLDLSSKVGHGTSFHLYFPITREVAEEDESEHSGGGTEKVLVVDDDEIQRDVSSQLLTKLGYRVSAVESGEKAVEFLRENPQDLVILDMLMPGGIDGAETYRQILEVNPVQKAIILSGFSESDRVLEAQKLGAGAFVRKPITKQVIAAAVRTELNRQVEVVLS